MWPGSCGALLLIRKALIEQVSETLLQAFDAAPLIDPYDVYQHLMDYWSETMQDDAYLVSADGWLKGAQPREIFRVKDKNNKLVWPEPHDYLRGAGRSARRFKSDLVPAALLVNRYFDEDRDTLAALDDVLGTIEQQLTELLEEESGDEGLLNDVIEGEDDKQKITKTAVNSRLREIRQEPAFEDEREVLLAYAELLKKQDAAKAKRKSLEEVLYAKIDAKYPKLTDDEVQALVIADKWLAHLSCSIEEELDRVSYVITTRIRELAQRYEAPLSQLRRDFELVSARTARHINFAANTRNYLVGIDRLPGFTGEWREVRLGDLATFHKGKGLPKSALIPGGAERCIHYGELFTLYGETIQETISRTTDFPGAFRSLPNDVLMPTSDVTPRGLAKASCVLIAGVLLGGDILVIRTDSAVVNGTFLSYVIRRDAEQVLRLVTGTTVFHIYAADMKKFEFRLPPHAEQLAIVAVLGDMDAEQVSLDALRHKTRALKVAMQQELLTSKTRLNYTGDDNV